MAIYITGDLHGENNIHKITAKGLRDKNLDLTEKDYLIICGDFGLVWHYPETKGYKTDQYWLNWLANCPWTTLFIDGNHENFDLLETFPIEKWNGGNVQHIVRNKVIHLMRGQVFNIDGKSIFDVVDMNITNILSWINNLNLTEKE